MFCAMSGESCASVLLSVAAPAVAVAFKPAPAFRLSFYFDFTVSAPTLLGVRSTGMHFSASSAHKALAILKEKDMYLFIIIVLFILQCTFTTVSD